MLESDKQDHELSRGDRKSIRYRLSMPVIVFHKGAQLCYAKIEDFSQNGLFLVLLDNVIPTVLTRGSKITLKLPSGDAGRASMDSFDAEILRISKDGIGVQLLKDEQKIIDILTNISKQQFPNDNQGQGEEALILVRKTTQLLVELMNPKLPVLAEQCLDECYEMISNRMLSPESNHFANRYFEALSELKTNKRKLIEKFLEAQQRLLSSDGSNQSQEFYSEDEVSAESVLSLVDEVEFEDWLAVQEMSKRIMSRHNDVLDQLRSQLDCMVMVNDTESDLVIGPLVLCSSFNEALCSLKFDSSIRVLIYPGLEEGFQQHLGQFYQELSAELTDNGYYPANQATSVARRPRTNLQNEMVSDSVSQAEMADDAEELDQNQLPVYPTNPQENHLGGQRVSQNQVSEFNALSQILQSMNMARPDSHYGQTSDAQPLVAVDSVDSVRDMLYSMAPSDVSNDDQLALQNEIIQALISKQGDDSVIDEHKSAELIANTQIFDALSKQVDNQSTVQTYIQQLQLPVLHQKLTNQNNDESTNDVIQHIINLLDQVISIIGDSNKSWAVEAKNHITELIQGIVSESTTRPGIFKDVEAELVEYATKANNDRERLEAKVIESCEGSQRVRKAKYLVNQTLQEHFAGKTVPTVVPKLLKAGWKQILVRIELLEGMGSEQWQQMMGVIDHLNEWLLDPEIHQTIPEHQIKEMINLVNEQLSDVGLDIDQHNKIMDELDSVLLGSEMPRVRQPAKLMKIKAVSSRQAKANRAPPVCRWVDSLIQGDWCEFTVGNQSVEKLKLLWLGSDPWHAVFVNQSGVKRLEFSKKELIKHYKAKMVRKIDNPDQPIASRAKHAVVEKLYNDARHGSLEDARLGLPNSKGLLAYLRETDFQSETTLVYVEIDDYRIIKQACGMDGSDDLMRNIAQRMQQHAAKNAMLARIDDQSLAMVLKDTSVDIFNRMASGWSEDLRAEPFTFESQSFPIALSIGLIGFNDESLELDKVLKNVALACAGAKQSGRNHIKVYSDDDRQLRQQAELIEWAGHIDKALAENRLVLACQPIVPICSETDSQHASHGEHYEVLLRVLDANGKIGPPGSFLSAGEQLRRMPDVDRWVITNLLQWMQDNLELVNKLDGFSVNLSGQSVASESFLQFVTEQVFEADFDPSKLTFEITETVAIDDFDYVKKFIQHMRKLGCKFSLDDFGSGYASYSYLRNLDVDYLKIDGLFVKEMHLEAKDLVMVKSMNNIAHSLGLKTIAEFVENEEILTLLGDIGVDYAQGYHLGKPTPMAELFRTDETSQVNSQLSA